MRKALIALTALVAATAAAGCGSTPGQPDEPTPTSTVVTVAPSGSKPKQPRVQLLPAQPNQKRPVDVEPQPWRDELGDIYEFRTVVDEVWRYCLVLVGGNTTGMHCFDSADVPR